MSTNTFAAAYDAAADHYDARANSFWDRFSRRTLEHLAPRPGDRILDVGCGSGAFAIPAAEAVAPAGHVVGVDLSSGLLALARRKAAERGFANLTFEQRDFLSLEKPARGYDAVVSVFSIFFVSDMTAAARHLWTLVGPGGALSITSWGPDFAEPATALFWRSITACRPDIQRPESPWERLSSAVALRELLADSGAMDVHVIAEPGEHVLESPEDWWTIVMGSGFRATVERLSEAERARVRQENLDAIRAAGIRAVQMNTVYGIARKPEG